MPGLSLRKMFIVCSYFCCRSALKRWDLPPRSSSAAMGTSSARPASEQTHLVQIGNIHCVSPKIQNSNQVTSESSALPKVQKEYNRKGNRHGKLPQGCFGTKIVDPSLSTVSLQYFCFLRMPDSTRLSVQAIVITVNFMFLKINPDTHNKLPNINHSNGYYNLFGKLELVFVELLFLESTCFLILHVFFFWLCFQITDCFA